MKSFLVQVKLGSYFEDLSINAKDANQAIEAAKKLVSKDASLAMFRHRYSNYIV